MPQALTHARAHDVASSRGADEENEPAATLRMYRDSALLCCAVPCCCRAVPCRAGATLCDGVCDTTVVGVVPLLLLLLRVAVPQRSVLDQGRAAARMQVCGSVHCCGVLHR